MKVKFSHADHDKVNRVFVDTDKIVAVFESGQPDLQGKTVLVFGGQFNACVDQNLDHVLRAIGWEAPEDGTK